MYIHCTLNLWRILIVISLLFAAVQESHTPESQREGSGDVASRENNASGQSVPADGAALGQPHPQSGVESQSEVGKYPTFQQTSIGVVTLACKLQI